LSFLAPTEPAARELEAELREYLNTLPNLALAPPWLPDDPRSPDERARHRLARQTYLKLQNYEDKTYDGVEMLSLQKKMAEARKQADKAEMESLRKQVQRLSEDAEREHVAEVRAGRQGIVDTNVIDLFVLQQQQAASGSETNLAIIQRPAEEMARHMGQAAPGEARFLVRYGGVTREGLLLNLSWLNFERVGDGAPALVDWLCAKGCTSLRYGFHAGSGIDED